jgi:hypothetical protein
MLGQRMNNDMVNPIVTRQSSSGIIWNLRLDQFRQKDKRLLPAKIASLSRDDIRDSFLSDVYVSPAGHLFKVMDTCIAPGRFGSSNLSV